LSSNLTMAHVAFQVMSLWYGSVPSLNSGGGDISCPIEVPYMVSLMLSSQEYLLIYIRSLRSHVHNLLLLEGHIIQDGQSSYEEIIIFNWGKALTIHTRQSPIPPPMPQTMRTAFNISFRFGCPANVEIGKGFELSQMRILMFSLSLPV
jgi:hypothetical protein